MTASNKPPNKNILQQNIHESWVKSLHKNLVSQNRLKALPDPDFFSLSGNDYLGLSRHPDVISAASEALRNFGAGATGSRFLSGNHPLNDALEMAIARFKSGGKGQAVVFSSGYHANLSVMAVLGGHCAHVYSDERNHASLIDGLRLAKAKIFIYPHNDFDWIKQHVAANPSCCFMIVTESLFSMEGDKAPLKDLYAISQRYGGLLVIDDAHGTGTTGTYGRGGLEDNDLEFDPDHMVVTGTFSKALGSLGGYAVLGNESKLVLLSLSRPFIYTTGLPPGVLAASLASLRLLENKPLLVGELHAMSAFWNNALTGTYSSVPIIPIRGNPTHLLHIAESLKEMGFMLPLLKYPTVEKGKEQLRLSVNLTWNQPVFNALQKAFGLPSC